MTDLAPALLAGTHYPACTDDTCTGCYPDLRPTRSLRGRGPGPRRDADGLSDDQRRTKRNRDLLATGIHPATGARLAAGDQTCGGCTHATPVHNNNFKGWKCELHRLGMSHSSASDIRVSWPACTRFEAPTTSGEPEAGPRP